MPIRMEFLFCFNCSEFPNKSIQMLTKSLSPLARSALKVWKFIRMTTLTVFEELIEFLMLAALLILISGPLLSMKPGQSMKAMFRLVSNCMSGMKV